MLSRFFRNWEIQLAAEHGDRRSSRPFRVGGDWWTDEYPGIVSGPDDLDGLTKLGMHLAENSAEFFKPSPEHIDFEMSKGVITYKSRGVTGEKQNRIARLTYRPNKVEGGPIVLGLPPWNLARWGLRQLLPIARRTGFGGASMSLPYQDERMPEGWDYAEALVSPDLGLTMRAMQQGVLDAMDAITILRQLGHRRIVVIGISMGSGITALLDMHDPRPDACICVLCANNFADCAWNGISTVHLRDEVEEHLSLEQLRQIWSPMEFGRYVDQLHAHPRLMRAMVTARFDFTFPRVNCRQFQRLYRDNKIDHTWTVLPCGHYSLSRPPFSYRFGLWIMRRLREIHQRIDEAPVRRRRRSKAS